MVTASNASPALQLQIEIRTPDHVAKAFAFSKKTGIPLSIKNTGVSEYLRLLTSFIADTGIPSMTFWGEAVPLER
jgi:hypothetical protein